MADPTQPGRKRFVGAWLVVLVVGGSLWWGLHPPRTERSYRNETLDTIELLRSNVETTRLWLDAMDAGKVTAAATEVALIETEADASGQLSRYSSYQPPDHPTTRLRAAVTETGDHVVAVLGRIRIAARSGRWPAAVALRAELAAVSEELLELRRQARP